MAISIEMETISPKKAEEYLATSQLNRSISERTVAAYATLIAREKWEPYPPIEFDSQGHLVNGHHRLHAVIKADTSVKLAVVRGVTPEMHAGLDTGRTRSMHDLFRMYRPETDYDVKRSAALGIASWLLTGAQQRIKSLSEYDLWIPPFRKAMDWAVGDGIFQGSLATSRSSVAGALLFAYRHDAAQVQGFAEKLNTGANLKPGSPPLALRNSLQKMVKGRSGSNYRIMVARQVLNCIRAYVQDEEVNRMSSEDVGRQFFLEAYKRAQKIALDAAE